VATAPGVLVGEKVNQSLVGTGNKGASAPLGPGKRVVPPARLGERLGDVQKAIRGRQVARLDGDERVHVALSAGQTFQHARQAKAPGS
jgi:hypothetical protein